MEEMFTYFNTFQRLTDEAREFVSGISEILKIKKNMDLQPIGHTCKTMYFLKSGIARIYYFKEEMDITESFSFENQLVVRYESLISGRPSHKGIQMLEDSELIAINATQLFGSFKSYHELESLVRKLYEVALVEQINRVESIQFHTADIRYSSLLRDHPNVLKRVPLKYIASYLGITPVSLSRIRSQY